jgi:chitinase
MWVSIAECSRGIYDRKHNVSDLKQDAHKLTHILYGFANLKEDGEVFLAVSLQ